MKSRRANHSLAGLKGFVVQSSAAWITRALIPAPQSIAGSSPEEHAPIFQTPSRAPSSRHEKIDSTTYRMKIRVPQCVSWDLSKLCYWSQDGERRFASSQRITRLARYRLAIE